MEQTIEKIKATAKTLSEAVSPDLIADLRREMAEWKVWLGEQLVDAEMAYNGELHSVMTQLDLPAVKADIRVKAGDTYRKYARIKQLYKDVQTVISAAKTKLDVVADGRYG
jgi:hypothetical protein